MDLPYYQKVRNCIDSLEERNSDIAMFCRALYLFGARASEITGERYDCDINAPEIIGPKGEGVELYKLEEPKHIHDVESLTTDNYKGVKGVRIDRRSDGDGVEKKFAVFRLKFEEGRIKKNEKDERKVALPLSEKFEPWTQKLYRYFMDKGTDYVFQLKRHKPLQYIAYHKLFEGLTYPVEYIMYGNAVDYDKTLVPDGLRWVRMVELSTKYEFNLYDMHAYGILRLRFKGAHEKALGIDKESCDPWIRYIRKLFHTKRVYKCKKCGNTEFLE